MSLLRKMAQLLAMLACVGLSTWAIGCGDPNANTGTTDEAVTDAAAADGGPAMDGTEAGSATNDGSDAGVEPPPMPTDDADAPTEGE